MPSTLTSKEHRMVLKLCIQCGLGKARHGWRVENSALHPVDRKTVEVQGYKAACAEVRYAT
jgi:hypothetical protein